MLTATACVARKKPAGTRNQVSWQLERMGIKTPDEKILKLFFRFSPKWHEEDIVWLYPKFTLNELIAIINKQHFKYFCKIYFEASERNDEKYLRRITCIIKNAVPAPSIKRN